MRSGSEVAGAPQPRLALALAFAMGLGSCNVKLLEKTSNFAVNVCTSDGECGANAACRAGSCFAQTGPIDHVLLEFVPEAANEIPSLSYLLEETSLATGDSGRLIQLPTIPSLTGLVVFHPDKVVPDDCTRSAQDAIPAHVKFTRTPILDGVRALSMQPLVTQLDTGTSVDFRFSTNLVPGIYDVYVEPTCTAAPMLVTGLGVTAQPDPNKPPAKLLLPAPARLHGTVLRKGSSLSNWEISLVEPREGRRISTTQNLGVFGPTSPSNFRIDYQPVDVKDGRAPESPIIQVTPFAPADGSDDGTAGPPLLVSWDLSAVDLSATGEVTLDMTGVPDPRTGLVEVNGQVLAPGQARGVASMLYFFSTSLSGVPDGLRAISNLSMQTDEMGHYWVGLLPGSYRVIALPGRTTPAGLDGGNALTPNSTDYAITETTGRFDPQPTFATLNIELSPKVVLAGQATTAPHGQAAFGATLNAEGSVQTGEATAYATSLMAKSDVAPVGPATVSLSDAGMFRVPIDPGTWDVSIRPISSESNLPWWVSPGLSIADGAGTVSVDAAVTLPVSFAGQVIATDPDHPTATPGPTRGTLRAFALAPDGGHVVQVGAARTNEQGEFRLLLPSAFGGTTTPNGP